jgi:membrane protease YdiL (CAAX protease family)
VLFYIKRHIALEITVTLLLAGLGIWGIHTRRVPVEFTLSLGAVGLGLAGAVWLTLWTIGVQQGYRVFKGQDYAENLTLSLAKHFAHASPPQILLGGVTAAFGEELFFRGFVQGAFGLVAGSVLFMVAHIGGKEIRVISYWSIFQGLYLGLLYQYTNNLLVPMFAHGLFDIGAMVYFQWLLARLHRPACEF